ncbi:hypothetical protein ACFPN7_12020 [Amycolatopsis halotolerans]|uniref:hypothetical protein n=1 Tax=Amycolatopsis halotolerans TaxID=330083 RepID=UPI00361551EB
MDQRLEVDEEVSFAGDDGTLLFFPQAAPGSLPQAGLRQPLAPDRRRLHDHRAGGGPDAALRPWRLGAAVAGDHRPQRHHIEFVRDDVLALKEIRTAAATASGSGPPTG